MVNCFLKHCWSSSENTPGKSFFRVTLKMCEAAYDMAGRDDIDKEQFVNGSFSRYKICEDHFHYDSYAVSANGRKRLLEGAKPKYRIANEKPLQVQSDDHIVYPLCLYYIL